MTPFNGRLLVGLDGHEPDVQVIRYASMVARLNGTAASAGAAPLPRPAPDAGAAAPSQDGALAQCDPEVRFVYLVPRLKTLSAHPLRAALREQVETYFPPPSERVAVGYDVLKGRAVKRLSALAADFDSDLLLLGRSSWPRARCGRLAMEAPCSVWLVPPDWAPVLRRLLVPIDFSERAATALRAAIDLARRCRQAKCLALHVYRPDSRFPDPAVAPTARRRLEQAYQAFIAGIDLHGVFVQPLFVEAGNVGRAIDRAAADHAADLVVMCTRRRSRSAGLVSGSVTEAAIREGRAAFLVVKSSERPVGLVQALRERLSGADEVHFS